MEPSRERQGERKATSTSWPRTDLLGPSHFLPRTQGTLTGFRQSAWLPVPMRRGLHHGDVPGKGNLHAVTGPDRSGCPWTAFPKDFQFKVARAAARTTL